MTNPISEVFHSPAEAFWRSAFTAPPEQAAEELPAEPYRDVNGSDLFQASYSDASGLPDWRNPIHPPPVEANPMDGYALDRAAAGLRDGADFADLNGNNASRADPRSNPSPYRIA